MKIGKYLSLNDIIKSQTAIRLGIDNEPGEAELKNIAYITGTLFYKVKDRFPDCFVSSFYRCAALNKAIGGASGSQHEKGEAIDIDSSVFNKAIFAFIRTLPFDQLIWEGGDNNNPDWVHVSLKREGNRRQILRAVFHKGKTTYIPFV